MTRNTSKTVRALVAVTAAAAVFGGIGVNTRDIRRLWLWAGVSGLFWA